MAQTILNPNTALQGLQFAIGGGMLPWNNSNYGNANTLPTGMPSLFQPAPSLPGPMGQSYQMGGPMADPIRGVRDSDQPITPAVPGAGGPNDVAMLSRKVKQLSEPLGSPDQPATSAPVRKAPAPAGGGMGGMMGGGGQAAMQGLRRSLRLY